MITYNGNKLPVWATITAMSFDVASIDQMEHEALRRVGNFDAGIDRAGVSFTFSLFIQKADGLSIYDQADELKRFIKGDNWSVNKFILNEQSDKYYNARVIEEINIADIFSHGETEITFFASDPKKYDVEETVESSSAGSLEIDYTGLEEAPLSIDIEFSQDIANPFIKHEESGRQVALEGQFSSGDRLTINTDTRGITLNDENVKDKMMFKSNWFSLKEGTNTLTSSSAEDLTNDFTVTYRTAD